MVTLFMAVGLLTLISRVVIGLVIPMLVVLGDDVCPVVCLYCSLLVPASVLTLKVTSISLALFGVVSWPFFAGFICTSFCLMVPFWLLVGAQRLAVSVPCFLCLSVSFAVLLS